MMKNGREIMVEKNLDSDVWADDMRSASAMFLEAGVGFEYLENR